LALQSALNTTFWALAAREQQKSVSISKYRIVVKIKIRDDMFAPMVFALTEPVVI
jgi:hypothetical protein